MIGIVRNKSATQEKVKGELPERTNIHIVQADITDYTALKAATAEVATITGGWLDYLIANAGLVPRFDAYDPIGVLGQQPEALEESLNMCIKVNVTSNIHLFNLFIPLILKGEVKKVIAISSAHAALDVLTTLAVEVASLYTISKAALIAAVAKFSAQYAKDDVLFMSIRPGIVDTGHFDHMTEEQKKGLAGMLGAFVRYAPDFNGPSSPEDAVADVILVMEKASVEGGDGGSFVSHFCNQQWL